MTWYRYFDTLAKTLAVGGLLGLVAGKLMFGQASSDGASLRPLGQCRDCVEMPRPPFGATAFLPLDFPPWLPFQGPPLPPLAALD